ncbi:MAG: HAMP domain-containing protein [Alcaligenaceae bacterium]|nr:HAMP domain-containing protein [Alcaligenaceae bacterium]
MSESHPLPSSSFSPRNWRIGVRLMAGFGLLIVMMLSIVALGALRIDSLADTNAELIDSDWAKAKAANSLLAISQANGLRTLEIYASEDPAYRANQRTKRASAIETFNNNYRYLDQSLKLPEARKMLAEMHEARMIYLASGDKVSELIEAGNRPEAYKILQSTTLPQLEIMQARLNSLVKVEDDLVVKAGQQATADANSALWMLLALGAAALIIALVMAGWITKSITAPLRRAVEIARAVAGGDLRSRIDVTSLDETGQLLQALKDMNNSLNGIVQRVRKGSDSIATATHQIAAGNLDLSSRTEEQAAALQETTASMQDLSGTVKQNYDSGRHANQLAEQAAQVALRGGEVVSQVVQTMEDINTSSSKISDIIGVIDSIAFQTNILALNAAVEAARAGEQGRGFAVVASEVRSLASRSAQAAKEIKALIEASVTNVSAGSELVEKAGSTMDEIVVSVRRVADIMGEISAASEDQSHGIDQINQAMLQMDQVTQSNAALVEEAAAAAQSLEQQAQSLVEAVGVFNTADTPVAHHAQGKQSVLALPA